MNKAVSIRTREYESRGLKHTLALRNANFDIHFPDYTSGINPSDPEFGWYEVLKYVNDFTIDGDNYQWAYSGFNGMSSMTLGIAGEPENFIASVWGVSESDYIGCDSTFDFSSTDVDYWENNVMWIAPRNPLISSALWAMCGDGVDLPYEAILNPLTDCSEPKKIAEYINAFSVLFVDKISVGAYTL